AWRVSDRRIATTRIPTQQAVIGQGHAGQRIKSLTEHNLLGDRSDYCGAALCVKDGVSAFEEVRERLAVLAVANHAFRHSWTDDVALDPAASALQGMVHRSKAIRAVRYRAEGGVSPAFKITGTASGDARKRIRALAASGCRTVLVSAPAKVNPGCSSAGIAPTKVIPGTCPALRPRRAPPCRPWNGRARPCCQRAQILSGRAHRQLLHRG